jgi:hypothetical protein
MVVNKKVSSTIDVLMDNGLTIRIFCELLKYVAPVKFYEAATEAMIA